MTVLLRKEVTSGLSFTQQLTLTENLQGQQCLFKSFFEMQLDRFDSHWEITASPGKQAKA